MSSNEETTCSSSCCSHNHSHEEEHHHSHDHSHDHDHEPECACEGNLLDNLDTNHKQSKKPLLILGIGIGVFLIAHFINIVINNQYSYLLRELLFIAIVLFVGKDIITHGIKSLFKKEIKIDFLITIAAFGAFLLGDGSEGAILILLYYLAEYLEEYALDKSKKSIINLIKLNPDTGTIKKDGKNIEVNVDDIKVGDIVVVHPGDKIPIDGEIIEGNTSINQASITGESVPVTKKVSDDVFGSTINEEGYIELKATKAAGDTVISKIIELVKESEEKKAKVDLFIDKFASIYTPLIVVIAFLVAVLPTLLFGASLSEWAYRALVLLVISCPCALAISTPVSMVSAITAGTKNGIIIKGGEYIEELSKIKAFLFDKTGTLTEGKLKIESIIPLKDFNKNDLIQIVCSIENKSKHPIAKTFHEYGKNKKISLLEVDNFESISGKGILGSIEKTSYYIGKESLFDFNLSIKNELNNLENEESFKNKTKLIVSNEEEILGYITLSDQVRSDSKSLISKLKSNKIVTMMLTGDNEETANDIASVNGLDKHYSNLLPEDKLNIVQEVVDDYKDVAMVGDGVNDSPALARVNVGIAMGFGGSDVAIETADIVLLDDKLSKIGFLIDLSKKTMNIIKQNVILSLIIKVSLAVLGVLGFIDLWMAVLVGDMGLTLFVVANAMRISKLES
ncbi:heavy metal translocating P-type ATPase [Methanobrevibacter sp. DSM 116169]|uniref:heavy metal translocating P-type ATPase n=1 Tax=Methanobrevibacter sp. DSM 116169 TaxID=3242727 RepID=UPI0038FBFC1A